MSITYNEYRDYQIYYLTQEQYDNLLVRGTITVNGQTIVYDPNAEYRVPDATQNDINQLKSGKQDRVTASGILKGNGSGGVSAAVAGTDYATPAQVNEKYTKPSAGIPKDHLSGSVRASLGKADTALQEHQSLAAYRTADDQDVIDQAQNDEIRAKYTKPSDGIPSSDLDDGVQASLVKANTALQEHQSLAAYRAAVDQDEIEAVQNDAINTKYTKPPDGIPADHLNEAVRASLAKADTALQEQSLAAYRTASDQDTIIGDLNDLATEAKSSLVAAINEAAQSGGGSSSGGGGEVMSVNGKTGYVVLTAFDVGALPADTVYATPAQVNEKYTLPGEGIPKSDLADDVKTSLGKADTALQEHQSLAAYRTADTQDEIDAAQNAAIGSKYTKPADGIPVDHLSQDIQDALDDIADLKEAVSSGSTSDFIVDSSLSETSVNPVQNKVITEKLKNGVFLSSLESTGLIMRKNNSAGSIETDFAHKGVDYASFSFQLTLLADGWTNKDQIIENSNLSNDSSQYAYIITPAGVSFSEYIDCEIYADDVTTSNYITFHAATVPANDLTVNVLRIVTATSL